MSLRDIRRYLAIMTVTYIGTALTSRASNPGNSVRKTLSCTRLPNARRMSLRASRPVKNRRVHYWSKLFFVARKSSPIGDVVDVVVADAANASLSGSTNASRKKHSTPISKLKHESLTIHLEFSR